jgi:hypothetical protein
LRGQWSGEGTEEESARNCRKERWPSGLPKSG